MGLFHIGKPTWLLYSDNKNRYTLSIRNNISRSKNPSTNSVKTKAQSTSLKAIVLLQKLKNKKARIGIIGLGYVGLPLVYEFFKSGFSVIGLDIDQTKIDLLNQGKSYIKHIPEEKIKSLAFDEKFHGSTDFSLVKNIINRGVPYFHFVPSIKIWKDYIKGIYK